MVAEDEEEDGGVFKQSTDKTCMAASIGMAVLRSGMARCGVERIVDESSLFACWHGDGMRHGVGSRMFGTYLTQ